MTPRELRRLPSHAAVERLLDEVAGARVLVVGDCMLDRYLSGDVERVSPEAPVPVVRVEEEREALGGAGNVAAGVSALGGRPRLVATVGRDEGAGGIRRRLEEGGIDPSDLVVDPGRETTVKSRVLGRGQQVLRIDRESTDSLAPGVREELEERVREALAWAEALVLVDYDKGVLGAGLGPWMLGEAAGSGLRSVVDPKLRDFFDYGGAFLFKPNAAELAAALGVAEAPRDEDALRRVRERLDAEYLLLTLGDRGMRLVGREESVRIRSRAREVYDVSGAGDTVTAVAATLLARDDDLCRAAALANLAAGVEVTRLGAVPVGREELLQALADEG